MGNASSGTSKTAVEEIKIPPETPDLEKSTKPNWKSPMSVSPSNDTSIRRQSIRCRSARGRSSFKTSEFEEDTTVSGKLEQYGEDTDFHGVKRILRKDYGLCRRLIWLGFFLIGIGFVVFSITDRLLHYFSYPHKTTVDVLYEREVNFPAVTICNMNAYRFSALTERDLLHFGRRLHIFNETMHLTHPEHYNQSWVDWIHGIDWEELKKNDTEDYEVAEFVRRAGHQKENMIVHCEWKGEECDYHNFTQEFTHLGSCYTFNSHHDSKLTVRKAGSGNALKLYLNVEQYEYLDYAGASDAGFKVLVHQQEDPPLIKELGFGVSPGFHHFVALKRTEVTNLPHPYGDCHNTKPKYFVHYGIPACRIECELQTVVEVCGCKLVEMPGNHSVCRGDRYMDCAYPALDNVSHSDSCTCDNPCSYIEYGNVLSNLKIRPATIEQMAVQHANNPNFNVDHFRSDLVIMDIYLEALSLETITQEVAYTEVDLLSDIGGSMGLYIGASVLTVLHLFEFLGVLFGGKALQSQDRKVSM